VNHVTTIEAFHALLTSEPDENERDLLAALRKLTTIDKPEQVAALVDGPLESWQPWREV